MAGYTRQSVADIVNGSNITAPPLNAEFNQLASAFDPATGHSHDGSSGNSPKIDLTTSITGYLPAIHGGIGGKNNTQATTNPTTTDDFNSGYAPGSIWLNSSTGRAFLCITNTVNNAVWTEAMGITPNNRVTPEVNNTVDIGSSVYQFKDIYIDGTGYIDAVSGDTITLTSNATVGGNITLTGNLVGSGNITNTGTGYFGGNLTANADLAVTGTLNAQGDVNLGNATSDTVTFISRVDSSIIPSTDGTYNLGSTTNEWQNLYITGTAEIDQLNADSVDIDAGTIDNTVIGGTTPVAGTFTTVTSTGNTTVQGNLITQGNNTFGNSSSDNVVFNALVSSNIVPTNDDAVDLGTSANQWRNLYIDGVATVDSLTADTVNIDGGSIDNTVIGGTTPVAGSFTTLSTSGQATLATADINGGTIDNATVGATTPSTGAFTTLSASTGITGDLTGNVTGNVTGNITGDITGDVTGDLTGNVTAATGSSTFNNVTINGTLDVTSTVISNVSTPVANGDAANKSYVDTQISNLIGGAPGALDTLNELAAALNDDANAYSTLDTKINTKVSKAGDTMTGALAMSNSKITGLGTPTAGTDAANKTYVDTQRDTRLATAGGTMTGNIAIGANKITTTANPVNADDMARKGYVDSILGSATAASASAAAAATSESNAATSETNASTSAQLAEDWAIKTSGTVDGTNFSAKYWATQADVGTIASNIANINTVAGIDTDVTTVAGISSNVTTVSGISADVTTVATNNADVSTVATNISDVNTVATNIGSISAKVSKSGDTMTGKLTLTGGTADADPLSSISPALEITNGSIYINHDEALIVMDEGVRNIASNDSQGNFHVRSGSGNDGTHIIQSGDGDSGLAVMTMNTDNSAGSIHFGVGPARSSGSSALYSHTLSITDAVDGLRWNTGSSASAHGVNSTSYKIYHSGNDGSGSGLDADTLDGQEGSSYLRSDAADVLSVAGGTNQYALVVSNTSSATQQGWGLKVEAPSRSNGSVDIDILNVSSNEGTLFNVDNNGDGHFYRSITMNNGQTVATVDDATALAIALG